MKRRIVALSRCRLTLPVVLLILLASRPAAALPAFFVIQQQTTPFVLLDAFRGFGASIPFSYFDSSKGALQAMDIDVTGANGNPLSFYFATMHFDHFCPGIGPCDGEALEGHIPGVFVTGVMGAVGQEIVFDATCSGDGICQGQDTETGFFSMHASAPNPAVFVGAGTFNVDVDLGATGQTHYSLPVNITWNPDIWSGAVTVSYTYLPAASPPELGAPEPGSAVLACSAAGLLVLLAKFNSFKKGDKQ